MLVHDSSIVSRASCRNRGLTHGESFQGHAKVFFGLFEVSLSLFLVLEAEKRDETRRNATKNYLKDRAINAINRSRDGVLVYSCSDISKLFR